MTPSTAAKAERLAATGKVHRIADADVFAVSGDSGLYLVVLAALGSVCTCPATGECSHILSARIAQEARS